MSEFASPDGFPAVSAGLPRWTEVCVATLGLAVLAPVLAICALAIVVDDPGPIFFRQKRVGRFGNQFWLLKLRSMRVAQAGPLVTADGDKRITRVGRFLRAAKLDEAPGLWNVLRGDMSLVGPRPEVPRYVDLNDTRWQQVLAARPGLTDPVTVQLRNEQAILAAVTGDREEFYRSVLSPLKLAGYIEYLGKRTWIVDLGVLKDTLLAVVFPSSARNTLADLKHPGRGSQAPRTMTLSSPTFAQYDRVARLLWKKRYLIALDAGLLALAFAISYLLRYEFSIPRQERGAFAAQLVWVTLTQTVAMMLLGVHRYIWRYIGIAEVHSFLAAMAFSMLPQVFLRVFAPDFHVAAVPLSITAIDTVFGLTAVLGVRILRRRAYEYRRRKRHSGHRRQGEEMGLLIGATPVGRSLLSELQQNRNSRLIVRGFVDDDPQKRGMVIQGVQVVGSTEDLPWLVPTLGIDHVVITLMRASRNELRRIKEICERIPVRVKIVPSMWELAHDHVGVTDIREFDIADLLGRESVALLGTKVQEAIGGSTVMVTGAGGSIGSELARQVARRKPGSLLLVERSEPALFQIQSELRRQYPNVSIVPLLTDITDKSGLARVFEQYRPELILHAAAHKHVPILETNVCDGVLNNIFGTLVLGQLAGEYGSKTMVLISTDKAVRPASILGATKRAAELVVQHLDHRYDCRYLAVRFGNVIGSTGSVIPVFREQIRNGGPVTVTDPEMVRYFMTIPEAAQLVLEAMAMGRGSEIFVLDMGEPVKILALARDLITLCGLRPYEDIDIVFTGMRPGEKIREELATESDRLCRTKHQKIFIGEIEGVPDAKLLEALEDLRYLTQMGDEAGLRETLLNLIPDAHLAPAAPDSAKRAAVAASRS